MEKFTVKTGIESQLKNMIDKGTPPNLIDLKNFWARNVEDRILACHAIHKLNLRFDDVYYNTVERINFEKKVITEIVAAVNKTDTVIDPNVIQDFEYNKVEIAQFEWLLKVENALNIRNLDPDVVVPVINEQLVIANR